MPLFSMFGSSGDLRREQYVPKLRPVADKTLKEV